MKRTLLLKYYIVSMNLIYAQFPVYLNQYEVTEPYIFTIDSVNEFLLTLTASSNTNWAINNSESSTLMISIDDEWINYNQNIVLYAGNNLHNYNISLGQLSEGNHSIELKFDYDKSSTGAEEIYIESIDIIDVQNIDIDNDVFLYSPILYG